MGLGIAHNVSNSASARGDTSYISRPLRTQDLSCNCAWQFAHNGSNSASAREDTSYPGRYARRTSHAIALGSRYHAVSCYWCTKPWKQVSSAVCPCFPPCLHGLYISIGVATVILGSMSTVGQKLLPLSHSAFTRAPTK